MKKKNNKGITLIALIITIIILLILAGISISALTSTGLFEKAKEAKQKSENAQEEEHTILENYGDEIDKIVGSRDQVTISKEEYETLKNANSYSTEEKEVGTWIDGSKLYKVSIPCNMQFSGRNWYSFDLGLSKFNIKQLVTTEYAGNGNTFSFLVSYVENNNLNVFLSTSDTIPVTLVTITYTKNE